jgi:hypothetical protein
MAPQSACCGVLAETPVGVADRQWVVMRQIDQPREAWRSDRSCAPGVSPRQSDNQPHRRRGAPRHCLALVQRGIVDRRQTDLEIAPQPAVNQRVGHLGITADVARPSGPCFTADLLAQVLGRTWPRAARPSGPRPGGPGLRQRSRCAPPHLAPNTAWKCTPVWHGCSGPRGSEQETHSPRVPTRRIRKDALLSQAKLGRMRRRRRCAARPQASGVAI